MSDELRKITDLYYEEKDEDNGKDEDKDGTLSAESVSTAPTD